MSSIPDPASIGSTPSSTIPGSSKADEHLPCPLPTTLSTKSFWHSDPSPLLLGHRSTRNLPRTADVVVIGSGITGASVAWHLLADANGKGTGKGGDGKGPNVLMLEAREACWGATGRVSWLRFVHYFYHDFVFALEKEKPLSCRCLVFITGLKTCHCVPKKTEANALLHSHLLSRSTAVPLSIFFFVSYSTSLQHPLTHRSSPRTAATATQ